MDATRAPHRYVRDAPLGRRVAWLRSGWSA